MSKNQSFSLLLLVLSITFIIYSYGFKADFIFDDYPNLQDLGNYGDINTWDKAKNFISNGFSGPTGRPISLASFLLNDNTWPSIASSFKYTNTLIHLLNGLFLYWAIILILQSYKYKVEKIFWIAFIASSIWILHPYFVSTTLYVVQRMAQLATLFSLIGIVGYLKARQLLMNKPLQAYFYMAISIGICTVLATYSKENGALLPLLILVLEFCNPNKENKPIWQWRALCLWLPSILVLYIIFRELNFSENLWPNRNFNQVERLYSESRIVVEYLYHLIIPQIEGRGLYQDGYLISKSLMQPITTLYSILFLIVLLFLAFILKNRFPLFSVAILFFFAAHMMESTVLGLELYFEHRNYLSALFLFLPIASGLYLLREKIEPKLVIFIISIILSLLAFFSFERVKLWGDSEKLQLYWAKNTPNSARAQNVLASYLLRTGKAYESIIFLESQVKHKPESALLNMQLLLHKIYTNSAVESDFLETSERLKQQAFDAQAVQALRNITEYIAEDDGLKFKYALNLINLIDRMQNTHHNDISVFWRVAPYLKAQLYLSLKDYDNAFENYDIAIKRYNDIESNLMMVAELASAGRESDAQNLLEKSEILYLAQNEKTLRRSKSEYNMEISRIKELFKTELAQLNKAK